MEGFLSFLFILILGFYVVGWLGRMLLRSWIRKKQREFAGQFGDQGSGFDFRQYTRGARNPQAETRREGEVTVQQTAESRRKKVSGSVGDYVEYEELEGCERTRSRNQQ